MDVMGDERTAIPGSNAGPSVEGTLMALSKEFDQVLERYPKMFKEGDGAEWEELSKNLDSSCTVEQRADALAFIVDRCRNMFSKELEEISPDLKESSRRDRIHQQLTQKAPLQRVTDLLLHVFTADQTGYGDVQCWCFKYHWDCLIILKVLTQHVSDLLGKSNAETDIMKTADATALVLNQAMPCLERCWHLVQCHSGTAFIYDIFGETAVLTLGIYSAADKLAIDLSMLKFRRMMIKFVCVHSYSILKGMADSAALTVDKETFLDWHAVCIEEVSSLRKTVKDNDVKQCLIIMSTFLDRLETRYDNNQEPTDAQLTNVLEWMEPKLKKFAPVVLRPYGEFVETCFCKIWDSDIKVSKELHSGALAENAAGWRLLKAATFLCATYGLGRVLYYGKKEVQGPNFFKQLAKQLSNWSQPRKDTVGQIGQGVKRQVASAAQQKDPLSNLTSATSAKRGGHAALLTIKSQGIGVEEGLLQLQSSLHLNEDESDKKSEMVVEAHASEGVVVPAEGPKADSSMETGARGPSPQTRASKANPPVTHNAQGQDNISNERVLEVHASEGGIVPEKVPKVIPEAQKQMQGVLLPKPVPQWQTHLSHTMRKGKTTFPLKGLWRPMQTRGWLCL